MSPSLTAVVALVVTAVNAIPLAAFTTTPDLITQFLVAIAVFLITGLVLLVLLWTRWMRALPTDRQCLIIWIVAVSTGGVVCLLPLIRIVYSR